MALVLALCAPARAAEVNVTPDNLNGWQLLQTGGSTVKFVDGPDEPLCGIGSLEFTVEATGATGAEARNSNYNTLSLDEITALSYSTFVQQNTNEQAPFLILEVDLDNNGTVDDQLIFEPVYQDATFFPSHPQGDVLLETWQTWDALGGGWYSLGGLAGSGPGGDVIPLADYIAENPDATIVNSASGGGVRIVTGFGGPTDWGNFIGNADCFTLGSTTYDFELQPDDDNDGVPNTEDHCPNSDLREFVDVGNGPTSVENTVDEEGCSIQDLVNQAMASARNHGQYVSAIAHLANDLRKSGEITNRESTILKTGAAKSSVGKKPKKK